MSDAGIFDLNGPSVRPKAGGDPRQIVVLLHGLGADGNDLIALAPSLAPVLPHALFVAPHAPFPCDMAPFGRQWFSLQDWSEVGILAGVRGAAPILDGFLDDLLRRTGLPADALILIGFSQGTMMALHVATRRAAPLAGVLGYSGLLAGPETLAAEITSRPPVLLIHGEADDVVPFRCMDEAARALSEAGVSVRAEARPGLGHGIDPEGLQAGTAFVKAALEGLAR